MTFVHELPGRGKPHGLEGSRIPDVLKALDTAIFDAPDVSTKGLEGLAEQARIIRQLVIIDESTDSAIINTAKAEIDRTNPCFRMGEALTPDQIEVARLVWAAAQSERPYTERSLENRGPASVLFHEYGYGDGVRVNAEVLEEMRQRRIRFSREEDIAYFVAYGEKPIFGVEPGMLNRAILENHLREVREQRQLAA